MPRKQRPEFTITKISKGNGTYRTIYAPRKDIKQRLKGYVSVLEQIALDVCPPNVVHGFWPARSCVSNAAMHIGYEYTACFDLTDFFDHCTEAMIEAMLMPKWQGPTMILDGKRAIAGLCPNGACRQGLPTSPAAANICASKMDWALYKYCQKSDIVYTRYADDLTFSTDYWVNIQDLLLVVPKAATSHGFQINERKTRVQCARAGRRVITGIGVDSDGVRPTRKTKRKLRAAKHKAAAKAHNPHWAHRAAGLAEWAKCKQPGLGKKTRKAIEESPSDALQIAAKATKYSVTA